MKCYCFLVSNLRTHMKIIRRSIDAFKCVHMHIVIIVIKVVIVVTGVIVVKVVIVAIVFIVAIK